MGNMGGNTEEVSGVQGFPGTGVWGADGGISQTVLKKRRGWGVSALLLKVPPHGPQVPLHLLTPGHCQFV